MDAKQLKQKTKIFAVKIIKLAQDLEKRLW